MVSEWIKQLGYCGHDGVYVIDLRDLRFPWFWEISKTYIIYITTQDAKRKLVTGFCWFGSTCMRGPTTGNSSIRQLSSLMWLSKQLEFMTPVFMHA